MMTPLHDDLENTGAVVHSYGMCGALAADWLTRVTTPCESERHGKAAAVVERKPKPTWLLHDLIAQHHPNLLIVELGDNMAGYGSMETLPRDLIVQQVREFMRPVAAQKLPCVWVGPPFGNENTIYHKTVARAKELSQLLSQTVSPCAYIDTTAFAQPGAWPTVDGEHLTPASYSKWSAVIVDAIVRSRGQSH
jgi:hypothetical protein